jgi:hypothetical protein
MMATPAESAVLLYTDHADGDRDRPVVPMVLGDEGVRDLE